MKFKLILSLCISLILFEPAFSTEDTQAYAKGLDYSSTQEISLPAKIRISAVTTSDVLVRKEDANGYPVSLALVAPIRVPSFGLVVEKGAILHGKLKKEGDDVLINTTSIITNGQTIPINALSDSLYVSTETIDVSAERAALGTSLAKKLANDISFASGLSRDDNHRITTGASSLGLLIGMAAKGEKEEEIISLPAGQAQIMTLEEPAFINIEITEQARTIDVTPERSERVVRSSPSLISLDSDDLISEDRNVNEATNILKNESNEYEFRNNLQYTEVVENIISLYKQGEITKDEAREKIESSNTFATNNLSIRLFPPKGVRNQVFSHFDYVYEIDK